MRELQDHVDKTMAKLDFEFSLLKKWFKKDFPEARMDIAVDLNQIKRELQIQCKILTGKDMADNQAALVNLIRIEEENFMDPMFMNEFCSVLNEKYRKVISNAINVHYHNEQTKEERSRRLG